jgi:membrane-associated PAP2 superfamily phosphatase
MMAVTLYDFLSGAVSLGFFVCALFFLRFWRRTRDGLFMAFALAFGLLGLGQAILALANIPTEERGSIYLIRLAAFALILIAIVRKNRSARA